MNAAFARSAPIILALTVCGLFDAARAQDVPAAQYELRQADPDLGSNIKRNSVRGAPISLDLPYEQLPEDNKQAVHSWWAAIPPGDEPPFPLDGLRTLFDPIGKAHAKLAQSGTLRVVAIVGKDGQVIEARILESPSEQLGQFAARLLMVTKFKPALCSGQPCRMEFPLNVQFVRR